MARTTGSHSEITGPRVRAAALRLFARHGFAAVSMRQIAMEVGVQVGALYNYTPDKQTLLFELMSDHMIDLLDGAASLPRGAPLADLEHFVRFHIAFHHDRPDSVFIAYMELRNLEPDNFAKIEALRGQYEAILESILQAGRFDVADRKITTLAIIALLTGVSTWFRTGGRLTLSAVQAQYWEMVQRMVGPEGGSV